MIHKKGIAINLGFGKIISQKQIYKKTFEIINDLEIRKNLHKNSRKEFDGRGINRMIKIISKNFQE